MKKKYESAGDVHSINSGKVAVGNQIVTSRGYGGGSATSSERPDSKKLKGPKIK